jgi:hypothetical protein
VVGNGPQPSGAGGVIATRTEEGGGRGRHERRWLTSGTGARRGPVAVAGVLGRKRESDEQLWGADMLAQAARFKPDLKQNPNSNVSNNFKLFQTLVD